MVWATNSDANRLRYSLRAKLSFSYILIILVCVAIISISSNLLLERQFRNYIIKQHEQKTQETVSLINQRYIDVGNWDIGYIENIGMNVLEHGMIIKVKDDTGFMIWDANVHNDGLCQDMLTSMRQNMQDYYNESEGGYVENSYPLTENSKTIGTVIVGFYGPYFYTESDLFFLNNINKLLIWAGVISLVLALMLGIIMSNQLSKPISRVIERARLISKGLYGSKIHEKSKTKEIRLLADTINNMAEALKSQQNFSKQTSLDIAHELRTPLTTVQGNLEAVIDGVMELDAHRIDVIYDEILRINRLVDDLGKLVHYESEGFKLNKSTFDLSQLVKRIIKTFESDFAKDNKKLIFVGDDELIFADMDKISQVVVNLISNALKFTGANGKVEIHVKSYSNKSEIIVKDNGIGIPNEDLKNIFERFYRSEKSRNRKTGGAGIGLAIVKSIVLAHEGTIKLNSESGMGSEFIISLPKYME